MAEKGPPSQTSRGRTAPAAAGQRTKRRMANPEKSGDAKLRDWDDSLTARQVSLCSPDCTQNRGNPAAQRYGA